MTVRVSRFFSPPLPATIVLLLIASLFAGLGTWQTKRAAQKLEMERLQEAATTVPIDLALAGEQRFSRIEVKGHYDPVRHILLDNQVWNGRAGVHVFTPFYTTGGIAILVNRGWLPLTADRHIPPVIPTPQEQITLKGRLNILPVPGRMIGQDDQLDKDHWPQLVTYLNHENLADALGVQLQNMIVQLSAGAKHGFEGRDWKPAFMNSSRHRAYAFQWYALTAATFVLWLVLGFSQRNGR